MRLVDRVWAPRKLLIIVVAISFVCFFGIAYRRTLPLPASINDVDLQNLRDSIPSYFKYDKSDCSVTKETEHAAEETFNSTYTHARGIYANGYETSYVPGTEDVFLMVKTGATVLWQRFPIHIATTLPQLPHFAVYSDAPDVVAGIPVIDILADTKPETKESDQFETWRQQQALIAEHANIEISQAGITGGWQLDKYKNIPMVAHGYKTYPTAKWYIFMDADTYILWPNMMRWLSTLNPDDMLYMGSVTYLGGVTPFVHGGSGVVMSGALIRKTFGQEPELAGQYESYSKHHCCGDHIISHAFRDRGVIPVLTGDGYPFVAWRFQGGYHGDLQAEPPITVRFSKLNWCEEIVTFHHLTAHDIEKIYEFEQKFPRDQPILFKDVYHEFVMPYLRGDRQNNWDNVADIREYSKDNEKQKDSQNTAYESYESCSNACDKWEDCMMFRYRPGYCGLSDEIRLGKKHEDGDNSFSSFWRLDRIRNVRTSSGCDPIDALPEEGEFFRQQTKA
ncbi:hypothetical protein V1525DRAFT_412093 [Lipomyces kononenkoae]|uniref:Uncharacterized protein n=1 Tax=Lipomyces kononenkoae TaxID=34357 RepID=A0ACC3SSY9_LIPKO